MTDCAVCYVSDLNFLLPTLVSAIGLRRYVAAAEAGVFIYAADLETARIMELQHFLMPYSINVIPMDGTTYKMYDPDKFNQTHVSPAALGRFFMEDALPARYKRIVYIDGDTWIRRDPSALINASVPEGRLAAAEDMVFFRNNNFTKHGKSVRDYFAGLGLDEKNGYFNSGVLAASRNTWRQISGEAFKFFLANTTLCKYHDQSALNAIIGDRRLRLSQKWNFQTPFRYLGIENKVDAAIYHFTMFPKPWMGKSEPWKEIYEPYMGRVELFRDLKFPLKRLETSTIDNHNRAMERKFRILKVPGMTKLLQMNMGWEALEKKAWL
jgi:lipopolysaccharide biosynthesis glycosyltransferase